MSKKCFFSSTHKKFTAFLYLNRHVEINYNERLDTERSTAQIEKHPEERGKLRLMIDGVDDSDWFRNKRRELLQMISIKPRHAQQEEHGKRKGMKLG